MKLYIILVFKVEVENQVEKQIKHVRTDGDGE
jgi:hypothetical protein